MRSVTTLSLAEDMNPRFRSTMEDAHAVVDDFGGAGDDAAGAAAAAPPPPGGDDAAAAAPPAATCGFFGIYDGHGGRNVAEYLRLHLHNNVERACVAPRARARAARLSAAPLATAARPPRPLPQASCAKRATAPWRSACARRFC